MSVNSSNQGISREGKSITILDLHAVEYLYFDGVAKQSYFSLPTSITSNNNRERESNISSSTS